MFRAVVKTGSERRFLDMLKHEQDCYANTVIRSSSHFRAMYDALNIGSDSSNNEGPYCLAFEWMDCTLKDVSPRHCKQNPMLHNVGWLYPTAMIARSQR